jgi:hypothetical protein
MSRSSSRCPVPASLVQRLWSAGFDPDSFPLEPGHALRVLTVRLTEELRTHAEQANSPLFNQVSLANLDRLHDAVSRLADGRGPGAPSNLRVGLPPLPAVIVGRDNETSALRRALLSHAEADVEHARGLMRVVRGWPGVGKSTIMATVLHDRDVRTVYADVLWATVTDAERVRSEAFHWARAVGVPGDRLGTSLEALSEQMRGLMSERRVLLVIDDVWRVEDALPFMIGGRRSATLVTTRLPALASALTDHEDERVRLDPLGVEDSLRLLALLAPKVVAEHREACEALARELEGLPLALQVAGRLLRVEADLGWGVEDLVAELHDGAALLDATAPPDRADVATQTTPSIATLLAQSTDRLEPSDRERFALLGVFAPKPATFDLPAIGALWGTPDPRPGVRTLVARGLLEPLEGARFQMHALLALHAQTLLD